MNSDYKDISAFNFKEWESYYGKQVPANLDILDVGYWYGPKSIYESPDSGHRVQMLDTSFVWVERLA